MGSERATVEELLHEVGRAMDDSAKFMFLVRDTELQQEQVDLLLRLKDRVKGFKYGAIEASEENAANALFHLQCALNAQVSFLRMWIQLKRSENDAAWDSLIDAQEYVCLAMRASDGPLPLEAFLGRLREVEEVVFPGFNVYFSWSAVIRGGDCTVCGRPLSDCEHVEGLVYSGRLCHRVRAKAVRLDHVAIVEQPRDRRCVVKDLTTDDGYYRDYMTWRKTKKPEKRNEGTSRNLSARIFSNRMLEVD
jgi:hypothetical protein